MLVPSFVSAETMGEAYSVNLGFMMLSESSLSILVFSNSCEFGPVLLDAE